MRISDWSSDVCSSDLLMRGAEQRGPARHFLDADFADPAAIEQRADDVRRHRDTAHVFDLATRDRLALANQCQRFEQLARQPRRLLLIQARYPFGVISAHLAAPTAGDRSEEHTSELQSLMRISYAVFFLKNKKTDHP